MDTYRLSPAAILPMLSPKRETAELTGGQDGIERDTLHSPLVGSYLWVGVIYKHLHRRDPLNLQSNSGGLVYYPCATEETGSKQLYNLP